MCTPGKKGVLQERRGVLHPPFPPLGETLGVRGGGGGIFLLCLFIYISLWLVCYAQWFHGILDISMAHKVLLYHLYRVCWTMNLTVMMSGRRRNRERVSLQPVR